MSTGNSADLQKKLAVARGMARHPSAAERPEYELRALVIEQQLAALMANSKPFSASIGGFTIGALPEIQS